MIRNIPAPQVAALITVLTRTEPLSDTQKTSLHALLTTSPRYAGLTPAQAFQTVNAPYAVPNPVAATIVPRVSIPKTELETALIGHLNAVLTLEATNAASAQPKPQITLFCTIFQAKLAAFQASTIAQIPVAGQLLTDIETMRALNIITDAEVAAFTTGPDPAYKAEMPHGPDAWSIAGPQTMLELSDVATALAG